MVLREDLFWLYRVKRQLENSSLDSFSAPPETNAYLSPLIFSLGEDSGMVSGRLVPIDILRIFSIGTPLFLKRTSSWVISSSFWKKRLVLLLATLTTRCFCLQRRGVGLRWMKSAEFEIIQSTYIKGSLGGFSLWWPIRRGTARKRYLSFGDIKG